MRKPIKEVNEDYLWAELKGNEAKILSLQEEQHKIRTELTHVMIDKIKNESKTMDL